MTSSVARGPDRARVQRVSPHLVHGRGYPVLVVGLLVALAVAMVAAVAIGSVELPVETVLATIGHEALGVGAGSDPAATRIVWQFRVPRVLLAAVVGAALSVAGATLQTVVRNPLADPYVLGVAGGASLGAVIVITLGSAFLGGLGVSGAAFVGALAALLLVFVLAQRGGRLAPTRLILAGVAIGYLCAAATSYLQLKAEPNQLAGILFWLLGTVAGASWDDLTIPTICLLISTAWLVAQGRRLNTLLMGEESAAALGVDVQRFRLVLLVVSSLLVGTSIAVAGGIGFVGLMIPHLVRLLVGPDLRRVLPVSAVLGALFLVLVDLLSRTIDRPNELPLGIFTAVIGVPFFVWLMRRSSRVDGAA